MSTTTRSAARTYCHLHLPKMLRRDPRMISVKTPDQPVHYVMSQTLTDVRFVVQPAGRARTLETGVRNVHAYVAGYPCHVGADLADLSTWRQACYRPVIGYDTFLDRETGEPVLTASVAYMCGTKVWYRP